MKKCPRVFLLGWCVLAGIGPAASLPGATPVRDPVRDKLGGRSVRRDETLLRLDADIDGDGRQDVCLAWASRANGARGFTWSVYHGVAGGYRHVGEVDFTPEVFRLGRVGRLHGSGLVWFYRLGGGAGAMIAFTIRGSGLVERELEGAAGWDEQEALCRKYFGAGPPYRQTVEVQRIPVSQLAGPYHLRLE